MHSVNISNALDLLLLAKKTCNLAPELLELFNCDGYMQLDSLLRQDLEVDFWPKHFTGVVCGENNVDFPLAACELKMRSKRLSFLRKAWHLMLVAL